MKNYFTIPIYYIVVVFLLSSCATTDYGAFFERPEYQNQSKMQMVKIPTFLVKPFLKSQLAKEEDGKVIIELVKKLKNFKLRSGVVENPTLVKDFHQYLSKNNFEDWMVLHDKNKQISIKAQENGDWIRHLFITIQNGKQMTLLDIKGNFNVQEISNLFQNHKNPPFLKIKE